jgi:hypothetical protein
MTNLKAMISSTAVDLPEHRQQAIDACLSTGVAPIGMEHLPARDESGVAASLGMVDEADNSALALDKLNERTQAIARTEAALQICEAIEDPTAAQVRTQLEKWKGDQGK